MKPKILFVFDHKYEDKWQDGLWAALNLLEKDFEVIKLNLFYDNYNSSSPLSSWKVDFMLGWGAFGSKVDTWLQKSKTNKTKKGLCIGGNATPPQGTDNYDVLFYETKWYRPQIKFHKNIVHAFGINTDIYYKVNIPYPIVWDVMGVGAFAKWKRWEKMLDQRGNRLVIGEYQKENETESNEIVRQLLKGGVMVSDMTNPIDLSNLMNYSRKLYIPADINGGGERAVLEGRAVGLDVLIEPDNPKLQELCSSPIYDHFYYAEQLKKGIESVL